MYVKKLTIENFKCFEKAQVELNYPGKKYPSSVQKPKFDNVNLFIGENGSGKSTVCQALCIAVLESLLSTSNAGFRTEGLVRKESEKSELTANLMFTEQEGIVDNHKAHAIINSTSGTEYLRPGSNGKSKYDKLLFEETSPTVFLAAYGANRRTERPEAYNERLRNLRYQRVASLFETHIGLIPLLRIFQTSKHRGDQILQLMNGLLPDAVRATGRFILDSLPRIGQDQQIKLEFYSEPLFNTDGVILPLSSLSDGYRLHIGWIADMIYHLNRVSLPDQKLSEIEGVVIVDEIDLLLHAEWQRNVVETLSKTFPKIQFLFTTHSPIVAGSVPKECLFLVDRVAPHTSEIHPCEEGVYGRSIDEILVRLFGLTSPRAPELELQLAELAKKAQEGDKDASIEYLRRLRLGVK